MIHAPLLSRLKPYVSRFTSHVLRLPPPVLLLPLILLFFNKMAFSNLILARGDTFLYFYPYWQAAADALRNGRIPLWNPHLFMGAPFLANSQVGFFYPLNWPVWLLLPIPYAVSASILLHLFIAGWGTYLAGRWSLSLERSAAGLAAVFFALGGYLTAQVEHVNQLQGLAWLPWFFAVLAYGAAQRERFSRLVPALAALFALQLLAGHTQTAFITGIGIVIWGIAQLVTPRFAAAAYRLRFIFYAARYRARVLPAIVAAAALASLLTAVQLLPTLELAQHSSRQGGLLPNEVLSFSLHPLLLARTLLPAYGQSLFSEYTAFLPVTALLLAIIGGWQWRRWRGVLPAVALVVAGLLLALGLFNPLYWLLARLPGFNLFRVPARWLALYGLGIALLAGLGWQIILDRWLAQTRPWKELPERVQENLWHLERPLRVALYTLLGLMLWSALATILAIWLPTGPEAPYEAPSLLTILGWNAELVAGYLLITGQRIRPGRRGRLEMGRTRPASPLWLAVIGSIVLFFSSRSQPYNQLTTPEAYFDQRPTVTRLLAETAGDEPPGRLLSLSNIFFDPGDLAEINSIYSDQLSTAALYDYVVALKQKEIIAPNLPLAYHLASVDGFDGGILPLDSYSQLTQLLGPENQKTTDGRLREQLIAVPDPHWLDLFNTRYLITDKVGDTWREGVFFDLQHPVTLAAGETVAVGHLPAFTATELWLIASERPGAVDIITADNQSWQLSPEPLQGDLYRVRWNPPNQPVQVKAISLTGTSPSVQISGLTLVNSRDNTFQPLVAGDYRLIHSGDVKIYENIDVLSRAFVVFAWQWQPDVAASVEAMAAPDFSSRTTAVLVGSGTQRPIPTMEQRGQAEIIRYEPEQVVLRTNSATDGLLVLTDANYPGWAATIDGNAVPIYTADALFRAVPLPAGMHEVVFTFRPQSFVVGQVVSLVGLILWLGLVAGLVVPILLRWRHR